MSQPNEKPLISVLVLSDVHAYVDPASGKGSCVDLGRRGEKFSNPLVDLPDLVATSQLSADLVICSGDLCNQADSSGFQAAWQELHALLPKLQAKALLATCGNHDLNSRLKNIRDEDPDPKGALQTVAPGFPTKDEEKNDHYWSRNFLVVEPLESVVVLLVNTSAYHGAGDESEVEHGRISSRTIDAIERRLQSFLDKKLYILVCHHQIAPAHFYPGPSDEGYLKKGQELLDRIGKATGTPWFVVHGHLHKSELRYGSSTVGNSPVILSAGGFGIRQVGVSNQLHLLQFYVFDEDDFDGTYGRVATWTWAESSGWQRQCSDKRALPAECGFGFRGSVSKLAKKLSELVGQEFMTWADACRHLRPLLYLLPDDLQKLKQELSRLGVGIYDEDGLIMQVGRRE